MTPGDRSAPPRRRSGGGGGRGRRRWSGQGAWGPPSGGGYLLTVRRVPDRSGPQLWEPWWQWSPRPACCACSTCSLPARGGPARSWPSGSRSRERTLRRDVTRLRGLGYPIEGTTGPYGGYRLGAAGHLPPLLLDDDEAVAVAVALRSASGGGASGLESAALSALTKLDQVLPVRLRERIGALRSVTVALGPRQVPPVDLDVLVPVAVACRRPERLRFSYRAGDGTAIRAPRRALPARLHRPALVPGGLRPGPRRLAHVPRRPHGRAPRRPGSRSTAPIHRTRRRWSPTGWRWPSTPCRLGSASTSRPRTRPGSSHRPTASSSARARRPRSPVSAATPTGSPASWPGSPAGSRCSSRRRCAPRSAAWPAASPGDHA